jgi:hypothetical protein
MGDSPWSGDAQCYALRKPDQRCVEKRICPFPIIAKAVKSDHGFYARFRDKT